MKSFPQTLPSHLLMVWDFCNLRAAYWTRYSVPSRPQSALFQMMNSLTRGFSWIALHWRTSAVIACAAVGIAVTTRRCLETDEARVQREQRNRKKELRALADRISTYGRKVHQRYPTGDGSRQRARLSGTTSQAPRHCRHSAEPALGRTKSPKGSPERVLEAQRLISIAVRLTVLRLCLTHVRSLC